VSENLGVLFVGGHFDDEGGRPSGYVRTLFSSLMSHLYSYSYGWDEVRMNGGSWDELVAISKRFKQFDVIIWMPSVPNDKEKLVEKIKVENPKCLLVTSKNNESGKYSTMHLLARALKTKSNLLLEFTKAADGKWQVTVLDPLGNSFAEKESCMGMVEYFLGSRIVQLYQYTRVQSKTIGEALPVPDEKEFFDVAKNYAEVFHKLIHANNDRFMGNLSFRCEKGFPSVKKEGIIYVSERNVDKRSIGKESFVAMNLKNEEELDGEESVEFYGDKKPSVDSPIQVMLYNFYKNVQYMLHSHTYVAGAPCTDEVIPCGAIEEAEAIMALYPYPDKVNFAVNLKGHGSIVFANSVDFLKDIQYVARKIPELQKIKKPLGGESRF